MDRGIFATLSGALAQEHRLQALAHNVANINTTGYKRIEPAFRSLVTTKLMALGVPGASRTAWLPAVMSPDGPVERVFVTPRRLTLNLAQGELIQTGNPFDLAIRGNGFFEVKTAQGLRYTRNGAFQLDAQRRLVTHAGDPVMGSEGPITLKPGEVRIDEQGRILLNGVEAARLKVVQFPDSNRLEQAGEGLYVGSGGTPIANPSIAVGALERSNVNPFGAMVDLIEVTRAYESSQKILQAFDRITELAIQDVGRVM